MEESESKSDVPAISDNKTHFECEKLKAEIDAIRRPFYKTASFYVSLTPVIVVVSGLLFSYCSGWFDVKRDAIKNEKLLLEYQTEKLKEGRIALDKDTALARDHLASLEVELRTLRNDKSSLTNQIALLERERDEMSSAKTFFEGEAKRLAGVETNSTKVFADFKNIQTEREELLRQISKLIEANNWLYVRYTNAAELFSKMDVNFLLDAALASKNTNLSKQDTARLIAKATSLARLRFDLKDIWPLENLPTYDEYMLNVKIKNTNLPPEWRVEPDPTNDIQKAVKILARPETL